MAYCEHYYGANEWMNCKIDVWITVLQLTEEKGWRDEYVNELGWRDGYVNELERRNEYVNINEGTGPPTAGCFVK